MKDKTNKKTARQWAVHALIRITKEGGFLSEEVSCTDGLDPRDERFAIRLLEVSLENLIYIDHKIDRVSKHPTVKMKPFILNLLRISICQMLFFDSVPDRAVINEAVELTKKTGYKSLSGFVNAVLRNIEKTDEEDLPLQIKMSVPKWIYDMWEEDFGHEKCLDMIRLFSAKRSVNIRVNTLYITVDELCLILDKKGIKFRKNPYEKNCLLIDDIRALLRDESFEKGLFYVQDTSGILAVNEAVKYLKKDAKTLDILDVCASPGGKSICAAFVLGEKANIISRDISDKKIKKIKQNIRRLNVPNITAQKHDALIYNEEDALKYDLVIADLPCSGLGLTGRKQDIRYRLKKEDIKELVSLQKNILDNVTGYVKKGGIIMYSTCTLSREENEKNASYICQKHGFKPLFSKQYMPDDDMYMDGFFVSIMEKNE